MRNSALSAVATNAAAVQLGQALAPALRRISTFADIGIVDDGLVISLTQVDSKAKQHIGELVANTGNPANLSIHYKVVKHASTQLSEIQGELAASSDEWARRGIVITTLLSAHETDTVEVGLSTYSDNAARQLYEKYGDLITVLGVDVNPRGASPGGQAPERRRQPGR